MITHDKQLEAIKAAAQDLVNKHESAWCNSIECSECPFNVIDHTDDIQCGILIIQNNLGS